MPQTKLTYFDIEGVAESVRLAYVINGVQFEDERIKMDEWAARKPEAKFGQLPEMRIEGMPVLAQSGAMLRHAGKTLGGGKLYPQDGIEFLQVEEAIGLVEDFVKTWSPCLYLGMMPKAFGYPEGHEKTDEGKALVKRMRETYIKEGFPHFLKYFTAMIEANKGFIAAGKVTIADCLLLPALRKFTLGFIDHVPKDCLEPYPVITSYIQRMMDIPEVKAWYSK